MKKQKVKRVKYYAGNNYAFRMESFSEHYGRLLVYHGTIRQPAYEGRAQITQEGVEKLTPCTKQHYDAFCN